MNLGAGGLGALMRRDLKRLATGKKLNTADIVVIWQEPKGYHLLAQTSAATEWDVKHALGEFPLVAVRDADGVVVLAELTHVSRQLVRVGHSAALAGTALCVRPEKVHTQAVAAAVWEVEHEMNGYPLVQAVVAGETVAAAVAWLDANTVRLTFGAPVAGVALLARAQHVHEQEAAAVPWDISHTLARDPVAQFLDAAGEGFLGNVTVAPGEVTMQAEEPVAGRGLLVASGPVDYLSGEFDPNLEETYSEPVPQSGTWPAFVHFVKPVENVERKFLEVEAGDVFLDFLYDVPLDGKRGVIFQVDGEEYVQKKIGRDLTECYDVLVGGERMVRTVLATRKR